MNEYEKDKLFVELSVDLGFICAEDASAAFQEQKVDEAVGVRKPVGAYLAAAGKLTRDQIGKVVFIDGGRLWFWRCRAFLNRSSWYKKICILAETILTKI